ncbi:MAG: 4Fe-4S ferredoxin [Candidatus Methanodesulfokora sp.]|jgi:hypothetical protein|nr:MAG: 4Fe-4S ferredoxin [Candidatus Korarchaeota archaeon]
MPRLMDINTRSSYLRSFRRILLYGSCLGEEILQEFDGYAKLSCCLEEEHANMVGFKLAGILARGSYDEIAVLTVDGSLHCVQLHHVVEEVCKLVRNPPARRHIVLEEGKMIYVPENAVKISRYLSRVSKLIENSHQRPSNR